MMSKLILNAVAAEYSGEYQDNNELWQGRAYEVAINNIDNLINEAKKVSENFDQSSTVNKTPPRIHDALFISGGRGTGKTVFLYNLAKRWRDTKKQDKDNAVFLDIIDPTLLIDQDNFVNVVIAHIHAYVQAKTNDQQNDRREYHRLLAELAESLGQTEYNHREASGLDRIIGYQSAMDLEKNFHHYIKHCCQTLGVDALVLPIDDVDMALSKAHDVLETIRRLLSCPHLVPVVCGDEKIYHKLLLDHFKFAGRDEYESRAALSDGDALHLSKQYWRKVFPQHLRVGLLPLQFLIPDILINGARKKGVKAADFITQLNALVTPLVNGQEGSHSLPMPDTPRKLVQLVKRFFAYYDQDFVRIKAEGKVDRKVDRKAGYDEEFERQYWIKHADKDFWRDFMLYAQTSDYNRGIVVGDAEATIKDSNEVTNKTLPEIQGQILISELALFNVVKQAEMVEMTQATETYNYYETLSADFKQLKKESRWFLSQQAALRSRQANIAQTLIPMPPLEFFKHGLSVSNDAIENLKTFGLETADHDKAESAKLLLSLYTHNTYYGTSGARTHQLFFGKAFEFFAQTVLFKSSGDVAALDLLVRLEDNAPFHSIYRVAPTKTFDEQDEAPEKQQQQSKYQPINIHVSSTNTERADDKSATADDKSVTADDADDDVAVDDVSGVLAADKEAPPKTCMHLNALILRWEKEYESVLNLARTSGLSHLLAAVMNKTFSQLHQMRVGDVFQNDNLYVAARRFQLVLINALASLLKNYGIIVQQNIAMTDKVQQLMSGSIEDSDRSYKVNVKDFIDAKAEPVVTKPATVNFNRELLNALMAHPLFTLLDIYNHDKQKDWLRLGSRAKVKHKSKVKAKLNPNENRHDEKDVSNESSENNKLIEELYDWARNDLKTLLNKIRQSKFMAVFANNQTAANEFCEFLNNEKNEQGITLTLEKKINTLKNWSKQIASKQADS